MANLTTPSALDKGNIKLETLPPMILIKGTELITKSIASVATKGKSYDKTLHLTACSILAHVAQHREVSLIGKLVAALAGSTRKNPLIDWFVDHGECTYDPATKLFAFRQMHKTEQAKAEAKPFWNYKPEVLYTPFNLMDSIASLIERAAKAEAKHAGLNVIDPAALAALKALVPVKA